MKNKHAGTSFDSFLEKEGIKEDVVALAAKRTFVRQLERNMTKMHKIKKHFREALKSPSTTERVFSGHTGISLATMSKAAEIVGCILDIRLIPKSVPSRLTGSSFRHKNPT